MKDTNDFVGRETGRASPCLVMGSTNGSVRIIHQYVAHPDTKCSDGNVRHVDLFVVPSNGQTTRLTLANACVHVA